MTLKPLQDFVLLKELKPEEKSATGIILPDDIDRERNQGVIVEKGANCILPVDIGEQVLFRSYGFDEVEIDKAKYLVGKEENIIGKLV